jgi:phosphatidylglycerol:prolipoprotein diacylglycerol transferase
MLGVITVDLDPFVHLGPLELAWHGSMIAVGSGVGVALALRHGREAGLDREALVGGALVMVLSGIVGARVLWLGESGNLLEPGDWVGNRGFSINGAVIGGALTTAIYLRGRGLGLRELDAYAAGFPLGLAVGRIGDVINGEHFGPASDLPWAFRHTHPDADVPSAALAYHSGGFYEVVLGLALFAIVWPLRHRLPRPGMLLWLVVGLYAAGRFAMFFYRSDSEQAIAGLNAAQLTSMALLALVAAGLALGTRQRLARGERSARSDFRKGVASPPP